MALPLLQSKLFVPLARPALVPRARLLGTLNKGLHRKLTLIAAPAGFGKSTLLGAWVTTEDRAVAWLSLDESDSDPARFLRYLVAALRTTAPALGEGMLEALQSPQPPPVAAILTTLLNEIGSIEEKFVLVLDDYHLVNSRVGDDALSFLLEHMPPRMHLVIATREDPPLPVARLRARGQLTELRAADLRFTPAEAAEFLNQAMGLSLSKEEIAALETRTEGWIAGLQLAALSLQDHPDATGFIQSFTGSHQYVLDYLVEEVLEQQPASVQTFLLRTSILDRLCGPLCDAVLHAPATSGQATLEYLDHANLFIVPLDNERRWYRYHHLFAELLRQRLQQSAAASTEDAAGGVADLHRRASQWYEVHGLELEAFQHAAAAQDVERAERLIEGVGVPLYFRGTVAPVLRWLESLPKTVLDATPSLWVMAASAQLQVDHTAVEPKLQAAEAALHGTEPGDRTRDLVGRIAAMRATLAVIRHDVEDIMAQSHRALEFLHPDNLPVRSTTTWSLGYAYQLQGDRAAARRAYSEVISIGESLGNSIYTIAATIHLGRVQEADNQLALATRTYQRVLQMAGDPPQLIACEAHLGLARILCQWNDLEAAEQHGQQCLHLTRQMATDRVDAVASYQLFLARLKLAQGDLPSAVAVLDEAEAFVRQHDFVLRMPEVVAMQVLALLRQGNLAAAAQLAQTHDLPLSLARVHLAQGETDAALAALEPLRQQAETKGWADERLNVMVLQALAYHAHGAMDMAMQRLGEALVLAEPGGFIRLFVDEGRPMAELLTRIEDEAGPLRVRAYTHKLLSAFDQQRDVYPLPPTRQEVRRHEPLSERELEVLRLLRTDLSGPEITRELMVSPNTMHTHTKNIYSKLGVNSRRAAVRRAEELALF